MIRFRSRTGLTMIELLVAVALLSIVMGGVFDATDRGLDLFRESSIKGDVNTRASRVIHRIAKEMRAVQGNSLVPDLLPPPVGPNLGSPSAQFRSADTYAAGVMVMTPPVQIFWELEGDELDNNLDDDGDGLVDEGVIVMLRNAGMPDQVRVVLAHGVREYLEGETPDGTDENGNGLVDERGLTLDRVGNEVTIRLSLERLSTSGRPVIRTQQTSITLRN